MITLIIILSVVGIYLINEEKMPIEPIITNTINQNNRKHQIQ